MSEKVGPLSLGHDDPNAFFGSGPRISGGTAEKIDEEVSRLLGEAHDQAQRLLLEHRDLLDRLSTLLLVTETIDGADLQAYASGDEGDPGPGRGRASAGGGRGAARRRRRGEAPRAAEAAELARDAVADHSAAGAAAAHRRLRRRAGRLPRFTACRARGQARGRAAPGDADPAPGPSDRATGPGTGSSSASTISRASAGSVSNHIRCSCLTTGTCTTRAASPRSFTRNENSMSAVRYHLNFSSKSPDARERSRGGTP